MSGSRRIACKLCRDRKVRCDGEQPACDRCRRAGEACVYSQTYNPTKAELLQTIKTLKDRVGQYCIIPSHLPFASTELWLTYIVRPLDTLLSQQAQMIKVGYNQPLSGLGSAISAEYPDCSPFNLPTPSLVNPDDPFLPSNHNAYQSTSQFPDNLDSYFLNYLPSPHPTEQNDPPQFQVESMISSEGNNAFSLHQGREPRSNMPSLREVRALNRLPSLDGSPPPLALPNSKADGGEQSEDCRRINSELTSFCSAVFATQAEIAGISSVVAEYLAWVHKRPPRSAGGAALEANWAVVLETLELRIRELHDMAETRHWAAWEQMMAMLKTDGLDAQFSAFEGKVQERTEKTKQFFQESYDVTVPLPEQMVRDQKKD